jgi:alpha-L-arabinofuranosidase
MITKGIVVTALCLLAFACGQDSGVQAQEPEAAGPSFTISAPGVTIKTDPRPFGVTVEAIRHVTADSQYFFRSAEGLQALKSLGVTNLLYTVDRNNWRALYDDMNGTPQAYPSAITPAEIVSIAKAIGAELVPIVNVTVQCAHIEGMPYTSENMTCERAKVQDAVDLVKFFKSETKNQGVVFKRVVMGLEPYAGCTYWTKPEGVNCTIDNPPGQHRIGLPAEEYVKVINTWAPKIKKVESSLEIGAQISPNAFYCKTGCNREWTQTVLQDAGKNIDFVLLHQYFRIPNPGAVDTASALKYSYYQTQADINLRKRGKTGMPSAMRKDILKWAPAGKGKMPIWYAEMNASTPLDEWEEADAVAMRQSLYAGLGFGELFLDMLSPVNASGLNPGGTRAFQHHLFATRTFLGAYEPPTGESQVMVHTPAWQIVSVLKPFSNKAWQTVKPKSIPTNASGRPTIVGFAARSGKKLTLAFFNHDPSQTYTIDAPLTGMTARKATITRVGDQAVSLFSQNNAATPNAIMPTTSTFLKSQIKTWGLDNIALPPHSVTVLQVKVE